MKRPKTVFVDWLSRHLPSREQQREYALDFTSLSIAGALDDAMRVAGLSEAAVAKKLRIGVAALRKRLCRGDLSGSGITVGTVAEVLWACGYEVGPLDFNAACRPLGIVEVLEKDAKNWPRVARPLPLREAIEKNAPFGERVAKDSEETL